MTSDAGLDLEKLTILATELGLTIYEENDESEKLIFFSFLENKDEKPSEKPYNQLT